MGTNCFNHVLPNTNNQTVRLSLTRNTRDIESSLKYKLYQKWKIRIAILCTSRGIIKDRDTPIFYIKLTYLNKHCIFFENRTTKIGEKFITEIKSDNLPFPHQFSYVP